MFEIKYSGLDLEINWFLFLFFLLLMIVFAILIPRFLVNLLGHLQLSGRFLTVFLLAIITSLPEIFTLISFVTLDNGGDNRIVKAFANIIGSNWMTSLAFACLFFYNSFILRDFFRAKTLSYSSLFVFFINCFLALVILFPDSFLNKTFPDFKFFSLLLFLVYLFFNFFLFYQFSRKPQKPLSEFKVNLFFYYRSPFLVLPLLIFFIFMLIFLLFFLVPLSAYLQTQHNFSDQSIGGLFFAFATSSTEIWACLSLLSVGLGYLGLGVIIESHLFNLLLYVGFAFFSSENVYAQLNANIATSSLLMMILGSFCLFLYTFVYSQKKKFISLFLSTSIIAVSLFGLIKLA